MFYKHDIAAAQELRMVLSEQAKGSSAEFQILHLQHIAEHGLPDCYDSFGSFLFDFYPDFSWTPHASMTQMQAVVNDTRFPHIAQQIQNMFGFDMRAELEFSIEEAERMMHDDGF
jgi:hypothetical protein